MYRLSPLLVVLLALSGCLAGMRPNASQCAWRVCVSYVDSPLGRAYTATNSEPVPVTIAMEFRSVENLRVPYERRVELVVPPRSSADVAYLQTVEPDRPVGASVMIQIDLGSSTTEADESFTYAVPFGGTEPRELVQGYDGTETHMGSMRYSLDFAMPEGTPVLAAREGTVLLVQDGFTRGGTDPALLEQANLVVVAHSDGTMASYGHLRRGLRVRPGQSVAEGQLLGYSGATGFAGQPHLHFHVGNRMLGEPNRTIPVRLRDAHGGVVELSVGSFVEPSRERAAQR